MKAQPTERHLAMKADYESGASLQAIGDKHGISRERVRQILREKFDYSARSHVSPPWPTTIARRERQKQLQEARCQRLNGLSNEERKSILAKYGDRPRRAFWHQRKNAAARGIEWQFKHFAEWFDFWLESGHWPERGRGFGYVMSRKGDKGPYSKENCRIVTATENHREYFEVTRIERLTAQ